MAKSKKLKVQVKFGNRWENQIGEFSESNFKLHKKRLGNRIRINPNFKSKVKSKGGKK